MSKSKVILFFFLVSVSISKETHAQNQAIQVKKIVLENGFTVFLNEDKSAKEVYGAVVVKAGSKNDPADATGIAHYLEHLLFKGTTELGTTNYQKEKPFLDSINIYYDQLAKTKDEEERKRIQLLINKQSVEASKFALPTEFDKLVKSIGGTNLNAFTNKDITVYHNSFPSSQIDKWLELYSHRFQNPVFRSFQSELEVVYEEKNRAMDDFETRIVDLAHQKVFPTNPYGTQSTLGTTEHLKNPSLTKMYQFFNTHYVANNMALVLSGNFNSEQIIPSIQEKFSKLRKAEIPLLTKINDQPFKEKVDVNIRYTPVRVSILGFKTVPQNHPDRAGLEVLTNMLSNDSETGRINKLQSSGKLMYSGGFDMDYHEAGAVGFFLVPKIIGQSFRKVEKLFFEEIYKISNGEILDKELDLNKTGIYLQRQWQLENQKQRSLSIVEAFARGISWEEYLAYSKQIEKVSKADIMCLAKQYFGPNHLAIRSRTGFPKKEKLKKPGFKPVVTAQKEESVFAKNFRQSFEIKPGDKFLDFEKDASLYPLNAFNKLYITPNPVNDIFSLKITYKVGSDSLPNLDLVARMFNKFSVPDKSNQELKERFALLGIQYYAYSSEQRFTIEFTGLEKNFEKSLELIKPLLISPQTDIMAMKSMVDAELTERKRFEKNPAYRGYMLSKYMAIGTESEFLKRPSAKELKQLKGEELVSVFKKAVRYKASVHYTGNEDPEKVKQLISQFLPISNSPKEVKLADKKLSKTEGNVVYLIHDKNTFQTQIRFLIPSELDKNDPEFNAGISAFNQYMSGDFSGLIMQEVREFRSLAYTAYGNFSKPKISGNPAFFEAYVGCQSDKTNEALDVMLGLIQNMPEKPERMPGIAAALQNRTAAYYPDFRSISTTIENYKEKGFSKYPLPDEVKYYPGLKFEAISDFYEKWIKNHPIRIGIYGDVSKIDKTKLAAFGKIVELKMDDVLVK